MKILSITLMSGTEKIFKYNNLSSYPYHKRKLMRKKINKLSDKIINQMGIQDEFIKIVDLQQKSKIVVWVKKTACIISKVDVPQSLILFVYNYSLENKYITNKIIKKNIENLNDDKNFIPERGVNFS